ncbi:tonB dependent receptor family protein [Asticcacaulis biprosthecium C19]|uniref:TonB dependent receptor family protein n=1 Tax=Asticcacaulis biprosthecium C19 TaxID=715226 RepID=F4QTK0_9CAUL|nr:TonB-dependent receptor [Asticcacaulis biprosthecium]EGF90070.1 tonB dependent receptor family protein [Asticcacaulis biprosthecium C19]
MTHRTHQRGLRFKALTALLLAGVSLPALAQAQDTAPSAEPIQDDGVEVVITAERRSQRLSTVPIAATVISGDITRKGVTSVADLQAVAPSVAINTFNRSTFINIRGVGIAQSAPTSSPGVAYYIDGQLIPHEQFIGQSFYDLNSVEVLRGPQGTLTGQNSTGGAIYVRTPEPKYNQYSGMLDVTLGDYGKQRVVGAVNAGFNDNVALRVAAVMDQRDSYTTNISAKALSQPGNTDLSSVRSNLAIRSSDDRTKFNLRLEWFDLKTDNNAVKRRNDTVSTDPFEIQEDGYSYMNQNGSRASIEVRHALTDGLQVRYLGSFQRGWNRDQTDGDRTDTRPPRPPAGNTGRVSNAYQLTATSIHEINLISTDDSPIQWVLGAFRMDEDIDLLLLRDNNHVDYVSTVTSTSKTFAVNTSESIFGQATWKVTPNWELLLGLRNSTDTQVYTRYAAGGPLLAVPVVGTAESAESTGKMAVNYHTDGGSLVYLSASKGYKAGGVNLTPNTPNFGPETNFVTELGFKTKLFDNHLRVNADVFMSDYRDIQLSSLVGALPTTQNATSGESKGAELELIGNFGNLSFTFGAGYLDAKFSQSACISDTNAPGTDAGCPTNLRSVPADRVLPFSPEWTINGGIQYDFDLDGDMVLTPRLQWSHITEQNATPFPSLNTIVPARDVIDARLTWDINPSWLLEGYINNLTDEVYIASQIQSSSSADGGIIYGAPRTYGVRALFKFGG